MIRKKKVRRPVSPVSRGQPKGLALPEAYAKKDRKKSPPAQAPDAEGGMEAAAYKAAAVLAFYDEGDAVGMQLFIDKNQSDSAAADLAALAFRYLRACHARGLDPATGKPLPAQPTTH